MFSQSFSQHLQCAEEMRLDTPLGTAHRLRGLRHIQLFPDAQEKCLLLPQREGTQCDIEFRAGAPAF